MSCHGEAALLLSRCTDFRWCVCVDPRIFPLAADRSLRVFNPSGSAMHSPSDHLALLSPISFPTVRLVCNFFLHILLWSPWLSDSHSYLCLVACIDSTHRYARTHPTAAGWVGEWFYDCLQFCNCN